MQFHAKAYPAIINGTEIVKMRVVGTDPTGDEHKRAQRVATHMSYQVLEEDSPWEEQHDRLLLILGIVGSCFVKTYYSPRLRHNVSELVMSRDLIINYWAKSVEDCQRKTHRIPLSRNDIRERVLSGIYRDVMDEAWFNDAPRPMPTTQQERANRRIGLEPNYQADETTPFYGLEMHCNLDLDGDGYDEPYIITLEESSKAVLRIVSRIAREEDVTRVQEGKHKGEIVSIRSEEYFTKYSFIPSPDGGIYDVGFGVLLGPLNESVNSIINQLVDAGTMANTAGGFLARGAKIRGGVYTFTPFGWNRVDSTGDDLRKSIFPLPVREPSAVLFQLLGMLINYTNRISGATDTIVGENPGQNTPAQTTQTMVEMGMKIYNAIYKRIWRSMKEEFRKLYILNALNLDERVSFGDGDMEVRKQDYLGDPNKVVPVADPNITSEAQQVQQAMTLKQLAMGSEGYNREMVERRVLKALHVDDLDSIYPGPGKPGAVPMPNPKLAIEQMKMQGRMQELQFKEQGENTRLAAELMEEHLLNQAKIAQLTAAAHRHVAEAGGVEAGHKVALMNATLGMMKHRDDTVIRHIEQLLKVGEMEQKKEIEDGRAGAMGSMATGPGNAKTAGMGEVAG